MPVEYEYGVQWVTRNQIITTGPKNVCLAVIESIRNNGVPVGRFKLMRRPKHIDWEDAS